MYLRCVKVSGGKRLCFDITIYRDTFSVVQAGKISRSRSLPDTELGLSLLERSTTQIDRIVSSIDLSSHVITVYHHA